MNKEFSEKLTASFWVLIQLLSSPKQQTFCAPSRSEFDGVTNIYIDTLMMIPLHWNSIHTPPSSPKSKLPKLSPTAMKSHFRRFSANSKSHHWASVKWTKSVYLSSETLLFPHEFSLNIVTLLPHLSTQQMENKFILAYFLNTEHAAGKITGGGVYTGCMIHHWLVVKIMLHFTFIPWGKVHFRSSSGNKILSLKNFGFLPTVKLYLRDATDRSV